MKTNNHDLAAVPSTALLADAGSPCSLYGDKQQLVLERRRKGEEVWVPFGHYAERDIEKAKAAMRSAMGEYMAFGWRGEHRMIRVRFEIIAVDHTANPTVEGRTGIGGMI